MPSLVDFVITAMLLLLMCSIGLKEGFVNLTPLWRRPSLLLSALLAAFVVLPLFPMAIDRVIPMGVPVRAGSCQLLLNLSSVVLVLLWIVLLNALYLTQGPSWERSEPSLCSGRIFAKEW